MRIAVLDDDLAQAGLISQILTTAGNSCQPFKRGAEMIGHLRRDDADIGADMLIVGWPLMDGTGLEVLQWVRKNLPANLPILLIAASAAEDAILSALAAGANDYLIKPVRRAELLTRVQMLTRRSYPERSQSEQIRFGQYVFEPRHARLCMAGRPIDLTQKEFELALLLFRHLGRPLSRAYIQESVWASLADVPSRTLDTHISRVRNKLQLRPQNGFRLAPVYSYGYQLEQIVD